ncbi:MAG: ATP-dependent helicase [Candidatus Lokiarchaeota archaeon]
MVSTEKNPKEEYVFEFYDEDYVDVLQPELQKPLEEYNEIDFESDLNDEQLEVINNIKGPMLIIAGAGSGKTRSIVYAVAKLLSSGVSPNQIMLVTFTNKAANEMIKRVETLLGKRPKGIWAGTFHSIANRFLRIYCETLNMKPNYTIMDEGDAKALMKLAISDAEVKELDQRFPTSPQAKDILSFSINCNKSIDEVILWKYPHYNDDKLIVKLKEVFKVYAKKKEADSLLDFDDLLVFWDRLLEERNVAQMIAKRIKYVLVDEYQDTNYIQDDIIHKIVKNNPEQNIVAVGDDAQSIYAFRGANFQNILRFEKRYENCKRYTITYNYRSRPQILELANDSIKHNKKQFKKKMKPTRQEGLVPYQVNVGSEDDQARFITNQVLKLRDDGFALNEIAILYRAASHSIRIEVELQAKNIPYEVRAGVSFFERAHIKDLLAHLKVIENPFDEVSWSRIFGIVEGIGQTSNRKIRNAILETKDPLKTLLDKTFYTRELKGIPKVGVKKLISHLNSIADITAKDDPATIIRRITTGLEDYISTKYNTPEQRLEDLEQLAIYTQKFDSIQRFLENLSLNRSTIESKTVLMGTQQEDEAPLILSTIHRAKGLEWRAVFIPMLCENMFPTSRVIGDEEAFEEERRVFYVAITRAKDQLYLISPSFVQKFGRFETSRISQFVDELNENLYTTSSVDFKAKSKKKKSRSFDGSYFTTADKI